MFDISWTEFLLIGIVALIVIGPKELPAVLRTVGQYTRKIRSMAADFQGQFQEAMREAEMSDLKKQVDDIAHDIKSYDPLKDVRSDVEAAGKDVQSALEQKPEPTAAAATPAAIAETPAPVVSAGEDAAAALTEPAPTDASAAPDASEAPATASSAAEPNPHAREAALVAAAIAPVSIAPVSIAPVLPAAIEMPAKPDTTGQGG